MYSSSVARSKSCIVAIVVPDVDVIKCWASENKIPGTLSVLCAHPEVKQLIMDDMLVWGKESGLRSFEQVKDIYLHPDPFSVQNGLLTPTFKTKRPQLKQYFKPQIEDICGLAHDTGLSNHVFSQPQFHFVTMNTPATDLHLDDYLRLKES
uniref:(California timema) hypothetical protein n=1 Tax=Timema californicum TaxID=61474 RepID=A0A7R9J6X3_TIMCA|nr:unnamed protein product [Timema californicum]